MTEHALTILCFGDSNSWGYVPGTAARYPKSVRWPGRLQELLGSKFDVIAEGLSGRAAVYADPISGHASAQPYFTQCLNSHAPIDLVVIMLGTNDMKAKFNLSAFDIAEGVGALVKAVKVNAINTQSKAPQILVVAPPPITELVDHREGSFAGALEKSPLIHDEFSRMCAENDVPMVATKDLISSSPTDGLHLEPEAHAALAEAVAERIRAMV